MYLKALVIFVLLSATPAPRQEPAAQEKEEEKPSIFQPTENLPVDEAVSFPVDI
ncbi:MAG: hypothetical protein QNK37_30030 [Acidobacteriota bacterium]|nr:hypothetical protein [Acidobacteriota bacterium]